MPKRTIAQSLGALKEEAARLWAEGEEIDAAIMCGMLQSLDRAWRVGKVFAAIKRHVGAGNWLLWLESNMPSVTARKAQRCMVLETDNPGAERVEHLSEESVRKFRLGYVPAKERPELQGDERFRPASHHLTVFNGWKKWQQHVKIGQATFDEEEARRDLRPMYDWMRTLYEGADSQA